MRLSMPPRIRTGMPIYIVTKFDGVSNTEIFDDILENICFYVRRDSLKKRILLF
jgi:hypothetical protein